MIADGIEIDAHGIDRFDGGLVQEKRRDEGGCTNHVACRNNGVEWVQLFVMLYGCSQVGSSTRRYFCQIAINSLPDTQAGGL